MKRCFIVFLALASGYQALANSIVVSNITRVGANRVQFQLSWQNSWMVSGAPGNHDAAWVFVKFRRCDAADLTFSHALLSTTLADHSLPQPQCRPGVCPKHYHHRPAGQCGQP